VLVGLKVGGEVGLSDGLRVVGFKVGAFVAFFVGL